VAIRIGYPIDGRQACTEEGAARRPGTEGVFCRNIRAHRDARLGACGVSRYSLRAVYSVTVDTLGWWPC